MPTSGEGRTKSQRYLLVSLRGPRGTVLIDEWASHSFGAPPRPYPRIPKQVGGCYLQLIVVAPAQARREGGRGQQTANS
jgi:hypothetical protein